ncbi:N-acetylglucosamine-6-phosphate deacetylase [Niabella drilacis]|uniref:N-acetylglucosamine-6-phosphate deacetylase n=1 Tax=Niabella drilacis (strain DSM 25811 / CCM 8410 / CCUG 62505 / LMG 26954 / E90) TaxID=1285928 RepID=A0A1G6IQZ1_NIADE|nr:N-acetylglucosamine-6-phosphate deacetylase [Niabella drilacis]SDC08850.1 N-acetylglucosamine-6-phosphate deacetylase [Niabella drilacis]
MKAIHNGIIYTGNEVLTDHCILVDKGRILSVQREIPEAAMPVDLNGKNISAGFIDIQLNGGTERYFSKDPDRETLLDMYRASRAYATPFFLTTLISSPQETIRTAMDAISRFSEAQPGTLGMHLEGPFMNPAKKGAHDERIIRKPTDRELDEIIELGRGVIQVMTIAPECFTDAQLERLLGTGIVLSAGHSMMSYEQAQRYFSMGINLVTHLFNAMTQLGHRECGLVGATFDNDAVYAPIILDGGHCHYAAARIAYRQKRDQLFLISDASFLGRQMPRFGWQGLDIEMIGGYYRDKAGSLAGAAISMPEAMKNAVDFIGVPLQEAVAMATIRPARAIRMDDRLGLVKTGYPAVFSVFDDALASYETLDLS